MKHNAKGGTIDDITLQPPGAPQQVTVTRADVQATEAVWRTDLLLLLKDRGVLRELANPQLLVQLLTGSRSSLPRDFNAVAQLRDASACMGGTPGLMASFPHLAQVMEEGLVVWAGDGGEGGNMSHVRTEVACVTILLLARQGFCRENLAASRLRKPWLSVQESGEGVSALEE